MSTEPIPDTNSGVTDIARRVMKTIAATQHLPEEKVTIDASFEGLGIDSLDGINILFALENEFDIDIPDDEAKKIRSIQEMVDGVTRLVESKAVKKAAPEPFAPAAEAPKESNA